MNLKEIIQTRMNELGAEKQAALIPGIEQRIQPLLEKKAAKLVTKRLIKSVFAAQLEGPKTQQDPKQLKLDGIE